MPSLWRSIEIGSPCIHPALVGLRRQSTPVRKFPSHNKPCEQPRLSCLIRPTSGVRDPYILSIFLTHSSPRYRRCSTSFWCTDSTLGLPTNTWTPITRPSGYRPYLDPDIPADLPITAVADPIENNHCVARATRLTAAWPTPTYSGHLDANA